jgi:transcriptional regulator with XRE-family HTH domain
VKKSIHSPRSSFLCSRLVELRKKAGLTQRDLAQKLGREQAMVARIEVGERRLDVLEFHTLLSILSPDPASELLDIFKVLDGMKEEKSAFSNERPQHPF